MKWLRRGWQRLRGSLSARETEMSEELAAHLGMLVDENLRRGMSQAEAERAARLSFGGLEAAKESYRDQRGLPWVETLVRDLRYATRGLRKSPGFTAVIVCTLAVAIGANTAVFSLVDQVLLRPRGVSQPERVVTVRTSYAKLKFDFLGASLPTMADLRESPEVYAYVAAIVQAAANYDGGGEPQRLLNASVTANWFHVFGAEPFLGRTFTPSDDQPNVNRVVVLSHDAWVRVFGADHSVVGRTIVLNDVPRQVIGVMPPEFRQPRGVDLWTPSGFTPQMFSGEARFNESGQVVARLREGVSMARAVAWMDVLTRRVHDDPQQGVIARNGIWSISVVPFVDAAVGETKQHLWILFAAVVLVALIACANIAGLMLARSSARAREFSVRVALGASKAQLMRGVFVESCLLAVMGGVAGLVAGQIGMDVLLLLAPPDAAIGLAPQMDRNLLMFSAVAVCGSAVLFGIPSMWWAFRMHGTADLGGGRIVTSGGAKPWGRSVLVVAETALAIVLLAVGGLFMRSLAQLQNVDAGFVSRGVLLGWIAPPRTTVPGGGTNTSSRSALFLQIWQNLRGRPDVSAAALASAPPFTDSKDAGSFEIEGRPSRAGDVGPHGSDRRVSPDYFAALRIPLKQGRSFTEQDVATGELVAVIDENLAREYWPGESPLGKRMRKIDDEWFRVVGVVGHVLDSDLATDSGKGTYYFSLFQRTAPNVAVMVRTNGDVTRISSVIREAVQSANPRLPVQMQSMEELVARSLAVRRFGTQLVGFFAAVGLFLSALGLYGVISYQVSQRRREIGVRMALGAARSSILQMVVGQGVRMACVGIGLGLIAAAVASRGLESVLYAVSPFDPITMLGVAGVVLATAVLASWLPAYRAVRIDPAVAVRPE